MRAFLAQPSGDAGVRTKFAVLETQRGVEVAEMRRFANALQGNQGMNYRELQDATKYLKEKRSGLLETWSESRS